jgi:hypothetical protein
MGLFSKWVITDKIEIKSSPKEIWDFFRNLEQNYIDWHPIDHRKFIWTGEPMKEGSRWYAEEMAHGRLFKLKGTIGEVIPYRKIIFKYAFPLSIVSPKFEWIIEPKEYCTVFTAISYLNAGDFFRKLSKKEMDWKLEATKKHTREEGEYLKELMEKASKA